MLPHLPLANILDGGCMISWSHPSDIYIKNMFKKGVVKLFAKYEILISDALAKATGKVLYSLCRKQ